jgi:arylsulfatase A-like enzyme
MNKLSLILVLTICWLNGTSQSSQNKPNIVFFLVDDMGWQDTSVPFHTEITELNKRYHTPNMELLASQGVMFTQAYAHSICSPTRVSLMTGMSPARHMVTNWTLRKNIAPGDKKDHPKSQSADWNLNGLQPEPGIESSVYAKTFPTFLQKAGYKTIHVGKAHFGAKDTPGENPLNQGFDVNIAGHAAGGPGSYHGKNNFSAAWRNADLIWDVPGLEKYHGKDINLTEALTLEANTEIEKAVGEEKPFYLYMSHYTIHAPWEVDNRFIDKYKNTELSEYDQVYASMIESMDKSLGDIMHNLKKLNIEENTIVVFMTDNGQPSSSTPNLPLKGHKGLAYEAGARVPFIVKWPGVTNSNTRCSEYFIIEDLFPTFLEMGGLESYDQIGSIIDGKSIVPLIKGKKNKLKNREIFWHFPHIMHKPYVPYSSIRKGDWKLIYFHTNRELELYNLKNDIGEEKNLVKENSEKTKELSTILSDFLRETKAVMSIDKRTNKLVEYPDEIYN